MDSFLSELEASAQKHVNAEYQNPSVDMRGKRESCLASDMALLAVFNFNYCRRGSYSVFSDLEIQQFTPEYP